MLSSVKNYDCNDNEITFYVEDKEMENVLNKKDHFDKLQKIANSIGGYSIKICYKEVKNGKSIIDMLREKFEDIIIK